ncbi:putative kinetochore protein [Rosellinia necatrix]|uniref:Putative kinetochore protein n=1 Tax=Rosellinia necatrix TaxID=77044 RepID=A0A1S7UIR2_ROSNE|nr:putative kinetochore protein [Rosellinia necatrix]
MAQGAPKKTNKPTLGGGSNNNKARANKPQPPKTKKGARVAKPRRAVVSAAADKLQRRLAAGITGRTERMLGERAGHLELIGPGKKARAGGAAAAADGAAQKGGSRKFG